MIGEEASHICKASYCRMAAKRPASSIGIFNLVKVGAKGITYLRILRLQTPCRGVLSSRVLHDGYGAARRMNTPFSAVGLVFPTRWHRGIYKGPGSFPPSYAWPWIHTIIASIYLELPCGKITPASTVLLCSGRSQLVDCIVAQRTTENRMT